MIALPTRLPKNDAEWAAYHRIRLARLAAMRADPAYALPVEPQEPAHLDDVAARLQGWRDDEDADNARRSREEWT